MVLEMVSNIDIFQSIVSNVEKTWVRGESDIWNLEKKGKTCRNIHSKKKKNWLLTPSKHRGNKELKQKLAVKWLRNGDWKSSVSPPCESIHCETHNTQVQFPVNQSSQLPSTTSWSRHSASLAQDRQTCDQLARTSAITVPGLIGQRWGQQFGSDQKLKNVVRILTPFCFTLLILVMLVLFCHKNAVICKSHCSVGLVWEAKICPRGQGT